MNENENVKIFEIDCEVMGNHYAGNVAVNIINGDVDLLGLCDDKGLMYRRDGIDLVPVYRYLQARTLRKASHEYSNLRDLIHIIEIYNISAFREDCVPYFEGGYILKTMSYEYNNAYYFKNYVKEVTIRRGSDDYETIVIPSSVLHSNYIYCNDCGNYVSYNDYDDDAGCCVWCKECRVIERYGDSHEHNLHPLFFIDNKNNVTSSYDVDNFAGIGFELEVQNLYDESINHNSIAYNLIGSSNLQPGEVRFAYDSSVPRGFEIISQPHTIKAFWLQRPKWECMLEYLKRNSYVSHKTGDCGLHVHVSRLFFGKTEKQQNEAISKIFAFFEENWSDLCTASRRTYFGFCDRNSRRITTSKGKLDTIYKSWKKQSAGRGSHGTALNNGNSNTFEFRLGRGSLNPEAFFSWIDLIITISKNAKRITVSSVESNDRITWLAGIKESTARYLYKRGAFTSECVELFPCIAWGISDYDRD